MTVVYTDAVEVEGVARPLIAEHHKRLDHDGVELRYVFRSESATRGGLELLGDVKKISGLASYLVHAAEGDETEDGPAQPMFVVVVAQNLWAHLDDWTKEALVDHLLSRCGVDITENGPRLAVLSPPVQDFPDVVARHGMWHQSLRQIVQAAYKSQPSLFDKATMDALAAETTGADEDDDDEELDPAVKAAEARTDAVIAGSDPDRHLSSVR